MMASQLEQNEQIEAQEKTLILPKILYLILSGKHAQTNERVILRMLV